MRREARRDRLADIMQPVQARCLAGGGEGPIGDMIAAADRARRADYQAGFLEGLAHRRHREGARPARVRGHLGGGRRVKLMGRAGTAVGGIDFAARKDPKPAEHRRGAAPPHQDRWAVRPLANDHHAGRVLGPHHPAVGRLGHSRGSCRPCKRWLAWRAKLSVTAFRRAAANPCTGAGRNTSPP